MSITGFEMYALFAQVEKRPNAVVYKIFQRSIYNGIIYLKILMPWIEMKTIRIKNKIYV